MDHKVKIYDALFLIYQLKRCDGVVDCGGWLQEDEGMDCQELAIQASCKDWFAKGYTESGKYLINPQEEGEHSFHKN